MKRRTTATAVMGLTVVVLVGLAGCSQNEYTEPGPAPQAPRNPAPAQRVEKSQPGEPAVSGTASYPADSTYAGSVSLSPSLRNGVKPGMVLYVIARPGGGRDATPLAAKRFDVSGPGTFPFHFELGLADSMSGNPLPSSAELLAKLDGDGDLATRQPGDLVADPVPVQFGKPVELKLREPSK